MKLSASLEKNFSFWFLLFSSILFFILRFPSLFEPYWYGDEGVYQAVGILMRHGQSLYSGAWDNKPPLLYILYAIFNSDQFSLRAVSLIFGLASMWFFYFVAKRLFPENRKAVVVSTLVYTFAFGSRLVEGNIANAENFMLLPIIAGVYIILSENIIKKSHKFLAFFSAGILISLAFLIKIVAIFDFAAFIFFILVYPEKNLKDKFINKLSPIILGFSLPVLLTMSYFFITNNFKDFMDAFLFSNVGYVGLNNQFIIPQGFLILKLIMLLGVLGFLFLERKKIRKEIIFLVAWFSFSLFSAFFSQRPYTHYLIMTLPSFCLLIGAAITYKKERNYLVTLLVLGFILINTSFHFNGKLVEYYENLIYFWEGKKDINEYQAFFDKITPRDYEIARYIELNTTPNDNVFIWGNNAQVYKLAKRNPIVRYTVAYHITGFPLGIHDMKNAIETKKPKLIIIMPDIPKFPLPLTNYSEKIDIHGAEVYEKIL